MIQIDMEMPSGCWNCKFKIKPKGCEFASHYDCLITKKTSAYKDPCNGENHDKIDCPLKEVPTGKWITTKQLEDMYDSYQKSLWREHEDIRGDDMVLLSDAELFLQEELSLLGCWDDEVEEQQGEDT